MATSYGIRTDFLGVVGAPMGLLTSQEYDAVVEEVPRLGMKDAFREVMCGLCRSKPGTTYDNMCADWGEKYVEGYTRIGHRTIDRLEPGLERLG